MRSRAKDKKYFCSVPDGAKAPSDEVKDVIAAKLPKGAQLQIIYGDGLSAEAINASMPSHQQAPLTSKARHCRKSACSPVARSWMKSRTIA